MAFASILYNKSMLKIKEKLKKNAFVLSADDSLDWLAEAEAVSEVEERTN